MVPRLSLRRKLLLAYAIVLLPILVLMLMDFQRVQSAERAVALNEQLLAAKAVAIRVDDVFGAAIGIGWAVANDPLVQSMNTEFLDPHLQRLVRQQAVYDAIAVFDERGLNRGWGQISEPAEPRLDISGRDYFQAVMSTNAPVVSNVLQLLRPAVAGVAAAVPIRGPDERAVGVVVLTIRAERLTAGYEGALRSGQSLLLADATGRIAAHSGVPDLAFEQMPEWSGFDPLRQALAGDTVVVEEFQSPILKDIRLGAFAPTPEYGWVAGVTMSRDVALADSNEAFRVRIAGFSLMLILSALLALGFARLLSSPVRRLQASARALGRGDLDRRVDINTGDEIEDLATAFNEMAARLQQRQREVLRLGAEMERRAGQLAAVIASMTEAVLIANAERRLVEANPAARQLLGLEDVALGDLSAAELLRPSQVPDGDDQPPSAELPVDRALAGEPFTGVEMRLQTPQGTDRLVSVSGAPVRDESGQIVLAVVVAHDITQERRQVEEREAVAEIARSLVSEIELSRVAEVVMEQSKRVLNADAVTLHLADATNQGLVLLAHNLVKPQPETLAAIERVPYGSTLAAASVARSGHSQVIDNLQAAEEEFDLSAQIANREGHRSLLSLPLLSRGRLVGVATLLARRPRAFAGLDLVFHGTLADLFAVAIENAHLYTEVREALRLREEFIAAAAHELKTPVTVIKGWAQMLLMADSLAAQQRKALQTIDRQADRVAQFIGDLLTASTLPAELDARQMERVDLSAAVRDLAGQMGGETHGHRLVLRSDTPLPVLAESQALADAIRHLLENAARYSSPGAPIEVETRSQGEQAIFSVRDHGAGIDHERQPYVFEPLYQPVPPGVAGYVGEVSLGLYLSKRIIDSLGGHIWFVSTPGEGSVFFFSLPLADGTDRPATR